MKRVLSLVVVCAVLALAQSALKAENAWVRLVPGTTSGAFMTLVNPGDKPIRVVGVESPLALKAEIHETTLVKGTGGTDVMQMRPVKFVEVPAQGKLELKPGGYHIMLMMLKEPLHEGKLVKLTLKLEDGSTLSLEVPVKAQ